MNQNGTYNGLDRGINNGLYNGMDVGALGGAISGDKRLSTIKLLDSFPEAFVAYSVRKLRTGYTGPCLRISRSSDNTEQDIGFTASGDLDIEAMRQFVGSANGLVVTWYDQSSNGLNATNAIAGAPLIIESGNVVYINNRPAMGGVQKILGISAALSAFNFLHNGTPSAVFAVAYKNSFSFTEAILSNNRLGLDRGFGLGVGTTAIGFTNVTTATSTFVSQVSVTTTAAANNLYSVINNVSATNAYDRQYIYRNGILGVLNTSTTTPVGTNPTYGMQIGANGVGTGGWQGRYQEIIIYNTDQSTNKLNIEKNINNYYKIY